MILPYVAILCLLTLHFLSTQLQPLVGRVTALSSLYCSRYCCGPPTIIPSNTKKTQVPRSDSVMPRPPACSTTDPNL